MAKCRVKGRPLGGQQFAFLAPPVTYGDVVDVPDDLVDWLIATDCVDRADEPEPKESVKANEPEQPKAEPKPVAASRGTGDDDDRSEPKPVKPGGSSTSTHK